ncbi:hypothetical protein [Chlorogloeopsis fritschii]|nr:hypothetical protein [Chlorogloeopsis fritschii]
MLKQSLSIVQAAKFLDVEQNILYMALQNRINSHFQTQRELD